MKSLFQPTLVGYLSQLRYAKLADVSQSGGTKTAQLGGTITSPIGHHIYTGKSKPHPFVGKSSNQCHIYTNYAVINERILRWLLSNPNAFQTNRIKKLTPVTI